MCFTGPYLIELDKSYLKTEILSSLSKHIYNHTISYYLHGYTRTEPPSPPCENCHHPPFTLWLMSPTMDTLYGTLPYIMLILPH